jgi:uncharacterized protein
MIAGFPDSALAMNAFVIDAFEFCRLKQQAQGEIPVAELGRLAQETVDRSGTIRWACPATSTSWDMLNSVWQCRVQLI